MKLSTKFDIFTLLTGFFFLLVFSVFIGIIVRSGINGIHPYLLLVLAGSPAVVLFFSRRFFFRTFIKPIRAIMKTADSLAYGDNFANSGGKTGSELEDLSKSVNAIAGKIADKMKRLEDSIAREQAVVRQQAILNELMGYIASGTGTEAVLRIFLEKTLHLIKAEHGGIYILESVQAGLDPGIKIFFTTLEDESAEGNVESMINGIFRDIFRTLTPLRINSPMKEIPSQPAIANMIAVPLSSYERNVSGLVILMNKQGGFTQKDEDILFTFAFQAFQAVSMQREILRFATTDGLTGLHNHRAFMEKLTEEIERTRRYSKEVSLLMMDIDHFKSFNDIYGHQAGDYVLKVVSDLIRKNIRNTDYGARYGGEEFAIILPETPAGPALLVAERLRESISNHEFALTSGETASVTVSLGYATCPEDSESVDMLIKRADQGLYFAKENGRNRVCSFSDIRPRQDKAHSHNEIDHILRDTTLTGIRELAKAADSKSHYMKGHSFEVAGLAVLLGRQLRLGKEEIEALKIASLLHDIGNLSIPASILNKPSPLTSEEKEIIRTHPGISETLLRHYLKSDFILPAILYHHERFDGTGYPLGLKGDEIPLQARILGLIEAYHAMISARPYRRRMNRLEALGEIESQAGIQFDPEIVRLLTALLSNDVAADSG